MAEQSGQDAVQKEKEMREHEREARERSATERNPADDAGSAENPAPPGNIQTGTNTGGG